VDRGGGGERGAGSEADTDEVGLVEMIDRGVVGRSEDASIDSGTASRDESNEEVDSSPWWAVGACKNAEIWW